MRWGWGGGGGAKVQITTFLGSVQSVSSVTIASLRFRLRGAIVSCAGGLQCSDKINDLAYVLYDI